MTANEVDAKVRERAEELSSKTVALAQMRTEEVAVKQAENAQEVQTKAQRNVEEAAVKARVRATQDDVDASKQVLLDAQYAFSNASMLIGNTALGTVEDDKTKLFVCGSTANSQSAYMQFSVLHSIDGGGMVDEDAIREGKLKLFKVAGAESPFVVMTTECAWSRRSLTYGVSQELPGGVQIGAGTFPAENGKWVIVELDLEQLDMLRERSKNMCLEVRGGPSTDFPVVVGSEISSRPPQLSLYVAKGQKRKRADSLQKSDSMRLKILNAAEADMRNKTEIAAYASVKRDIRDGLIKYRNLHSEVARRVAVRMSEWRQQISPLAADSKQKNRQCPE